MGADSRVEISERPIPQEPMVSLNDICLGIFIEFRRASQYIIMNLGMSRNFGFVDLEHLTFPTTMHVDYIRVYQPKGYVNIGCDPKDFPTAAYINQYVFEVFFEGCG